ncbi:TetR family transcriptional regulator [Pseudonocardia sediminis]|uniref:TetR family transcriptional regulator n=1 Tax=Pseudonocardia sediminis TaxID=1397368 RepID=A0A4Q7V2S6_PSEST|nr:TetR/AcrR family transcriptional regulator [Pseudonocardia sediminis]RZT87784.1 TetR family transcriptional regulator [Pseudonocardia sediminis]
MAGVRAEQRERTRQVLVERSRELFATRGYADVGLAEIVTTAGVTKGALYHHFPDGKTSLFAAVLGRVQDEVGDAVAAAAGAEPDDWSALLAGCRAFLVSSTAAGVSRIMLVDGPAVLGWARWRELDDAASGRHLLEALEGLVRDGVITARPEPLARLLSGAMNEAALWLADRDGDGADPDLLDQTWTELATLLTGLRR